MNTNRFFFCRQPTENVCICFTSSKILSDKAYNKPVHNIGRRLRKNLQEKGIINSSLFFFSPFMCLFSRALFASLFEASKQILLRGWCISARCCCCCFLLKKHIVCDLSSFFPNAHWTNSISMFELSVSVASPVVVKM